MIAKQLGNSLAIEWVVGRDETAQSAIQKAKQRLVERGYRGRYQGVHPQVASELPAGHLVIVTTEYQTLIGRQRTSYGCGFSAASAQQAETAAVENLQAYSWGWKPEFGYAVHERVEF